MIGIIQRFGMASELKLGKKKQPTLKYYYHPTKTVKIKVLTMPNIMDTEQLE